MTLSRPVLLRELRPGNPIRGRAIEVHLAVPELTPGAAPADHVYPWPADGRPTALDVELQVGERDDMVQRSRCRDEEADRSGDAGTEGCGVFVPVPTASLRSGARWAGTDE
jgi:hypothetical protein